MSDLGHGLVIVLCGMAGTFVALTAIMSVISLNGLIFGKRKSKTPAA